MWKQSFQAYFDDAKDLSQESRFKQVLRIKDTFKQY